MIAQGASATEIVPVAFNGCFGSLHRPTSPFERDTAVVLCAPVGREALCAYRPLFLWADALASCGFHVLRYDHPGEGDSLELDPAADQWARWREGVIAAVEVVRGCAGRSAVALAGLRIGALLAASVAEAVQPEALALLAPPASGIAWLRELRWAAALMDTAKPAEAIGVQGLGLSPATVASLAGVELRRAAPPRPSVFLAAPNSAGDLAERLGPDVTVRPFTNYAKLFRDSHLNVVPTEVFDAAAGWLESRSKLGPRAARARTAPAAQLATTAWVEQAFATPDGLRGVLSLPVRAEDRRAVIFGNTAADPRAGAASFTTRACRALAAAGVAAARLDFPGFGESAEAPAGPAHVYETPRIEAYRQAAAVLRLKGHSDVVLAGVCTGGYHAVQAVLAGEGFHRAVAINSWLAWRGGSLVYPGTRDRAGFAQMRALASADAWRRVLRGEGELGRDLDRVRARLRQIWVSTFPDAACRAIRKALARAAQRGVQVKVVCGGGDASLQGLEDEFGVHGRWLARRPGMSVSIRPELDHALLTADSQAAALSELFAFLDMEAPATRDADAADASGGPMGGSRLGGLNRPEYASAS